MFIDDGYTQRASVASADGPLVFEFRPMLPRQRRYVLKAMEKYGDYRGWEVAYAGLTQHITVSGDTGQVTKARSALFFLRERDFMSWKKIFDMVVCGYSDAADRQDRENLCSGVPLLKTYGHLQGATTCDTCRKWLFDPESGELEVDDLDGQPIARFDEAVLACETEDGCPNGTPDRPRSLSAKNRRAFIHYQECAAVGAFPNDPIVRRNAAIIRPALTRKRL